MIKLKLSSFKSTEKDARIDIVDGEKLDQAVTRALEGIPLDKPPGELFQCLVNGLRIEPDLWSFTSLKETDEVLIAPLLKTGSGGDIFKSLLVIGAALAASYFFGPEGYLLVTSSFTAGVIGAGAAIATSLTLNALIPPAIPEANAISGVSEVASSQMYSISSQANATKKYGTVPKVYGTHRIFPFVAANPYTELHVDPATGELAQYLFCIYDFGLGPMTVEQILIGDTSISVYDCETNLVDTGKPAVAEGAWDSKTTSDFRYYKGDVEAENIGVTIDGNEDVGDPITEYQVERNTPVNVDSVDQSITLTFLNPQGLFGYSSTGQKGDRTINLDVYFSKVGEDNYKAWNDDTFVSNWTSAGGNTLFDDAQVPMFSPGAATILGPATPGAGIYIEVLPRSKLKYRSQTQYSIATAGYDTYWGYPIGTTDFYLNTNSGIAVGDYIRINGKNVGKITAVIFYAGITSIYRIDTPTTEVLHFFTYFRVSASGLYAQQWWAVDLSNTVTGKVYRRKKILSTFRITKNTDQPAFSSLTFTPREHGQFKVRVRRKNSSSTFTTQVSDSLIVSGISTRFARRPIQTDKRHVFLEMKIKATNQLNGAISNLSGVVSSALDVFNGSTWSKEITSNPAWIYCDLLTGEINKRAIDKSRLHTTSILEWAAFCDAIPTPPSGQTFLFERFQCNFILDYTATLQDVINQVTSSAQAGLNIIDGKYGVLIDKLRTTPVQIFTPRNSRDFASVRNYTRRPDAVKMKYIDPAVGWDVSEVVVYDNGFDATTALDFDEMTCFGATNNEQAWRTGRYFIAANRLRQETITIGVDFEYLVCTRGDYVRIAQDVMKVGGTPARVTSVVGNTIGIDNDIEIGVGLNYGFVFRNPTTGIISGTLTVNSSDSFDFDGSDFPEVGDLVIIGEVDFVWYDCIVKSISPNEDLSATLTLVEQASALYDAESTNTLPEYNPQLSKTINPDFAPPQEVTDLLVLDNFWRCKNGGYEYYIDLDWDAPISAAPELYQIFVDDGRGYTSAGTTRSSLFTFIVDQTRLDIEHSFKILAVSATGKKLDLSAVTAVTATPVTKTTSPSDIDFFVGEISNQILQLSWTKINDCDCKEYAIRYSPEENANWATSIPHLVVSKDTTLINTQARTGVYLIKAVDFNGNESVNSLKVITAVPELTGFDEIFMFHNDYNTDLSPFPPYPIFPGTKDHTTTLVDANGYLVLEQEVPGDQHTGQYYSEGYYYFNRAALDLPNIFITRLESRIKAQGYSQEDLLTNWDSLEDVEQMYTVKHSEWDVELQYRTSIHFAVMEDWDDLTDSFVPTLDSGIQDEWTPWRKITIADATCQVTQFRLKLISRKFTVSPLIKWIDIHAYMQERIFTIKGASVAGVDTVVNFDPFFFTDVGIDLPRVLITIENPVAGDLVVQTFISNERVEFQVLDSGLNKVVRNYTVNASSIGRSATAII